MAVTTDTVTNLSGVTGATASDALNTLNTSKAPLRLPVSTVTSSKTLAAGDANTLQRCSAAGTINLTVNGSVFSAGDVIPIFREGAGAVTVVQGSGMTLRSQGSLLSANAQYSYIAIVFLTSTLAVVVGDRA